ncbi:MAG: O-antigen ligase C-terminal domain-containing protein [Ottowia sp.]|nr:O-antigen ligase C-terminal domain-containing protein [Ottowia sp.]
MPIIPLCAVLLALPWLWPFTAGPMATTLPYLVAAGVAAVLLVLWPRDAERGATVAATGWLAAAGLSALIALLQYFDLEAPLFPWVNIAQPGQAFGNLRQPNQLASLLVIGALALRWWVQAGRVPVGAALALGALLMAALAATASRVGLVALLACGALVAWWALRAGRGQRAVLAVGGAVALYVLAALALPQLAQWADGVAGRDMLERLRTGESTCGSRLILWRNVLHLISLKPWTGWGWGELDYAHYITLYEGARFCHILDNAHNLPLHLAVELGVPVALAACAALAWLVWRGRPWAEQHPTRQLAWGVLAVIGIHSLVEYPLWYGPFQMAAVVCVWLLWATRDGARDAAPGLRALRYPVAAAMLAAVAYAGWDYHRISQIYLPLEQRAAMYRDDAMGHAQKSWLYADAVRFAEVTTRPAVRDNAAWMLPAALRTLHFSPEPRVAIKVIESATLLGRDDSALAHLARFRAAFAAEHQRWAEDNLRMLQGARELMQPASESAAQ